MVTIEGYQNSIKRLYVLYVFLSIITSSIHLRGFYVPVCEKSLLSLNNGLQKSKILMITCIIQNPIQYLRNSIFLFTKFFYSTYYLGDRSRFFVTFTSVTLISLNFTCLWFSSRKNARKLKFRESGKKIEIHFLFVWFYYHSN